ncbi:MAG: hypothetical protein QOJ39_1637 [Candidatus Eremiobacteraeota bacterium]|jgi:hypothetical protein|nr:hypothetical protein [Candidatus Eremiobacteraeota bacterium]
MMLYDEETEVSQDAERVLRKVAPATVFFISKLARIVDISQLAIGDDEEDFFVPIPSHELHEASQRVADLEYEVREHFGVGIRVLPIPMKV